MNDREPPYPPPPDVEHVGPTPLAIVLRRWPLLAVSLAIGAVLGAAIHMLTPPTYQSGAQLLVVKKRTDVIQGGDVRVGVLEDYVANQVMLIKSERIRFSAARILRTKALVRPPEATSEGGMEAALADAIRAGLVVARDKDATAPGTIGSNVLNLTFRGPDPTDAKTYLDAVIQAYTTDLGATYDRATEERLKILGKIIDDLQNQKRLSGETRIGLSDELLRITTENVGSISGRITAQRNQLSSLRHELISLKDQLGLIEKAGKDQRDRRAVLTTLTAQIRPGGLAGTDPNSPEAALRVLEAQRKELSEEYGKDHQQMKAVDSKIAFYKQEIARMNPENPDGQLDELAAFSRWTEHKKRTAETQIKLVEDDLHEDEKKVKEAGRVQNKIDAVDTGVKQTENDILKHGAERSAILATTTAGGYSADTITQPGFGAKVTPVLYQSVLMALAIGLLLGGAAVGVAELTDKSFRSPAEVRRRLGLPIVGFVPQLRLSVPVDPAAPKGLDPSLVAAVRPKSAEAESFRGIRTQLYFSTQGRGNQVIQVTSPSPGDGKSTLAANLAISIAQSGKRVALIDADFRKPRVHKLFSLSAGEAGLAGVIDGTATVTQAMRPTGVTNLDVLPCGPRPANPAELLTSPRFQELLAELKAAYAFVVIDTPPLLAVSDPAAVAPRADGVLMVFRMTGRARPSAERAREQLSALGANVLGVVVNGWSGRNRDYGDYNYGGGYRYMDYRYSDDYASEKDE